MLIPKRVKHRKQFRGRMKGRAMRGNISALQESKTDSDQSPPVCV